MRRSTSEFSRKVDKLEINAHALVTRLRLPLKDAAALQRLRRSTYKRGIVKAHASFYIIRDGSVALTKDKQTVREAFFFAIVSSQHLLARTNSV